MVATTGALVVFKVVNEVILPLPDAASPIEVVLFVQLNVVPTIVPLKLISVVEVPTQFVWFAILSTVGIGFTVTVITFDIALHNTLLNVLVVILL